MSTQTRKPHELKARSTISLEPWLLEYAAQVGRGNISLGVRYALLEYRNKLDPEIRAEKLSAHS